MNGMVKNTITKKLNKYTIILLLVFLIIGFFIGYYTNNNILKNKNNQFEKTLILNNEINNCISELNKCNLQNNPEITK
jgi:preprotein translocase subunit SecG